MNIEFLKPIQTKKEKKLIFNEICMPNDLKMNSSFWPFVIFYDSFTNEYYYLKIETNVIENRTLKKGQILIKGNTKKNSLLSNDSIIDCSQIFKIDANLLLECIEKTSQETKNTKAIKQKTFLLIIEKINELINEKPPYLSLLKIFNNNKANEAISIYLCQEKYNEINKLVKNNFLFIPKGIKMNDFAPNTKKMKSIFDFKNMFQNMFQDDLYI